MRLSVRTFLWSFVPLAVLLAGSFQAVQQAVVTVVHGALRSSLRDYQLSLARTQERNEQQNRRYLKIVGENAALRAGVQLFLSDPANSGVRLTVEDQLREIAASADIDLLMLSTPDGAPVAGVAKERGRARAIDVAALQPPSRGYFLKGGDLYQMTSVPIEQGDESLAVLSVGERDDFSRFQTPMVLLHEGTVIKSTAPEASADELERSLAGCRREAECELKIAGQTYLSQTAGGVTGGGAYQMRSLVNTDSALQPVQAVLRQVFAIAGAGAMLATVVMTWLSSLSVVRPIQRVVEHLRTSAKTGTMTRFDSGDTSLQEIRELIEGFNRAADSVGEGRQRLHQAYVEFVGSLASALDARDSYTAGHSSRVAEFSCAIARATGFDEHAVEQLRIGALLHDIGKIGVPDAVLGKPGRLTEEEFGLIRQHPAIGRRILEGVHGFAPYLEIVELHHENQDGTGYPHGLRGDQVPASARIVHVADAYDAMTSDRPYRPGMKPETALRILRENSGTQFDGMFAEALARLVEGNGAKEQESLHRLAVAVGPSRPVASAPKVKAGVLALACLAVAGGARGQEAPSGFELRATVTGAGIYSNEMRATPAARAMLYPTWKLSGNWTVAGAVQVHTRPYFNEQYTTQGRGVRGDLLQAHLTYSRFAKDKSVIVRAGQLSSAFGSFLLRYDDADNPLANMPLTYGYYYKGVTSYGMAGAQIDVTWRKLDARAQLVNSSPANRRSVFDTDQYGNWAGGVGYTVVQGLRVGASAYNGPYLHRQHRFYRQGEAKPSELRATAAGVDVQWARGHWSSQGEWQWFHRPYRAMNDFVQDGGYGETRRVIHPRLYVAARVGYLRGSSGGTMRSYESAVGYRPNRHQLIKSGYEVREMEGGRRARSFVVQVVTRFRVFSWVGD